MGMIRDPVNTFSPEFVTPPDFISLKLSQEGEGQPRNYTIVADQNYVGTMAMTTLTFTTQTTLTVAADPGTAYDAIVPEVSAADRIYVIFALAAGGSRTRIQSFDTSGFASVDSVTETAAIFGSKTASLTSSTGWGFRKSYP